MSHVKQVATWHRERPDWTLTFSAREWDVLERAAEAFDEEAAAEPESCELAPAGSYCTEQAGHRGACRTFPQPD